MAKHTHPASIQAGFTLVEVMVALAIVAVALAAFARMTSQSTSNQSAIEQRTLALLSAENSLAELRAGSLLAAGSQVYDCSQADQALVCRVQVSPAQQGLLTVAVEVYGGGASGQLLAHLQTRMPESRP
ncbi:MAG: type II secretion system minor pseudopilin GspI [Comamonas sp.]|jgi:general secretion pathway protein I|nr:type II secretion system minor pseudopilin GspI [Comamonas sp.]